ncbi:MAG TPA: glucuronate isomerase [Anaerolineaceae bacterium]|nr:glucuronate isomerase [Anaerolineaceae bacterium]
MNQDRFFSSEPNVQFIARQLYQATKEIPIFAPHGHVDPAIFTDPNTRFGNPVELFIHPDHYIIRTLYANGIPLEDIGIFPSGHFRKYDPRRVWRMFCEKFYLFRGTPSGIWLTTSLNDIFGIEEKLSTESAEKTYDILMEKLSLIEFSPRSLFETFNIELLATTDSAADFLPHHQKIQKSNWKRNIIPTFRFDSLVHILNPGWIEEIKRLSANSNFEIRDFKSFVQAIEKRRIDFQSLGATATDFSAESAFVMELPKNQIEEIFQRALRGKADRKDANQFVAHMLMEMARMSAEDGMVMQFHAGIYRNHNKSLFQQYGADIGGDFPVSVEFIRSMHPLFQRFGNHPNFRLILFTLDESTYTRELAPLAGHYPTLRLGPPWWFNDSINGIERYLNQVVESPGIYKLAGFNDDTRGFCSIPARHDLWRRLCANWLAGLVVRQVIDEEDAHQMMIELSVGLARKAYNWKGNVENG